MKKEESMNGVYVKGNFVRYTSRTADNGKVYHTVELIVDDNSPILRLNLDPESVPDVIALKPMDPVTFMARVYVRENTPRLGTVQYVREPITEPKK